MSLYGDIEGRMQPGRELVDTGPDAQGLDPAAASRAVSETLGMGCIFTRLHQHGIPRRKHAPSLLYQPHAQRAVVQFPSLRPQRFSLAAQPLPTSYRSLSLPCIPSARHRWTTSTSPADAPRSTSFRKSGDAPLPPRRRWQSRRIASPFAGPPSVSGTSPFPLTAPRSLLLCL